jgi:hypothetical protein
VPDERLGFRSTSDLTFRQRLAVGQFGFRQD